MQLNRILPISVALLGLVACGEKQAPKPVVTTTQTSGAPAWIDNEEIPDGLAAVGIAQPNPMSDKALQRTDAINDARAKMAGKLKVRVQNMFSQLNQRVTTAASGDKKPVKSDVMQRVQENVTRTLVDQELAGTTVRHFWTDPSDNNLYVFLVMTKDSMDKALSGIAQAQIRKEIAQGEKALESALDKLDAAIAASSANPQ